MENYNCNDKRYIINMICNLNKEYQGLEDSLYEKTYDELLDIWKSKSQ